MINSSEFYSEYHGHTVDHLCKVHQYYSNSIAQEDHDGIIYLAGDSSLDNKFWFGDQAKAVNGYENILKPARSRKDIAYWLSSVTAKTKKSTGAFQKPRYGIINCAVEESSIGDRACGRLLPQDSFIKDHITERDILVVSVGGNDIALKPSICTILNLICLIKCIPSYCVDKLACGAALPCDDCCAGFACGCCSNFTAWPPGAGYFVHLFKTRVEAYLDNLIRAKPRKILISMIYYPDEHADGSWADRTLGALGYGSTPEKTQLLIRKIFEFATSKIQLKNYPDVEIVPVPLFVTLDGKNTDDYSQRVEPSASGGEKMAKLIMDAINGDDMMQRYQEHCHNIIKR